MLPWLVPLVMIVGLLLCLFAPSTSQARDLGKWMFICALVGLMVALAPTTVAHLR